MNTKQYYTLQDSLSDAGAALAARNLRAEYEAGAINREELLHLTIEKRLTVERRNCRAYLDKFQAVQFERLPDEGLL